MGTGLEAGAAVDRSGEATAPPPEETIMRLGMTEILLILAVVLLRIFPRGITGRFFRRSL